jgi:hypothetical protein
MTHAEVEERLCAGMALLRQRGCSPTASRRTRPARPARSSPTGPVARCFVPTSGHGYGRALVRAGLFGGVTELGADKWRATWPDAAGVE